jgi:hypothetical protein
MHLRQSSITANLVLAPVLLATALITGCATITRSFTSGMADNLSDAVLNQNDLETVRQGAPAFLLVLDGLINSNPDDQSMLLAGARLYGAYASAFVDDEERQQRLATKSFDYGRRAICISHTTFCNVIDEPFNAFKEQLGTFKRSDVAVLFGFSSAWATWIQVNSDNWNAIIQLPKVEALLHRIVELDESHDNGSVHLYLGVLATQLPPEFGGKPKVGRKHFERANELANGRNLMVKVLYAQYYARMVFDQKLHDSLLNDVLTSPAEAPDMTLSNMLAKQRARKLLEESNEFF